MDPLNRLLWTAVLAPAIFVSAAHAQTFGRNLIVNGDAEASVGSNGTTPAASIPGWTVSGPANVVTYASGYDLKDTGIVPFNHGKNYFAGGPSRTISTLTQTIDLTAGSATIDAGAVTFDASAYLGGSGADNSTMRVDFAGTSGNQLSTVTVGPVSLGERPDRALYYRQKIGPVPIGARSATVTVQFNPSTGTDNRAYADNVALRLNATQASSLFGPNLIVNGDAESAPGSLNSDITPDIPGWQRSGNLSVNLYADSTGDLSPTSPGPANRGANYFYGGPANAISAAYQDIDISAASSQIDGGRLSYDLAGWVGGYQSQGDDMSVQAGFRNWAGITLGYAMLAPAGSTERNNQTALVFRDQKGTAPPGTRYVRIAMVSNREEGSYNDGLADNLFFTLAVAGGTLPAILGNGVVSAGAFGGFKTIAPGSWIEIYGTGLATTMNEWGGADFQNGNAPTTLNGVTVTIGGKAAFVRFVSPGQVNVQVPSDVATGTQQITVSNANGTSAPYAITVNPVQPGVLAPTSFVFGGRQFAAATFADGTFVLPAGSIPGVTTRAAKPGDVIVFYGVGFGPVTPNIPAGQIVAGANQLTTPLRVTFGNTPAQVIYQGMAPNYVGLYQFNVVVPEVSSTSPVPVTFSLGGAAPLQTLYTTVE